MEEILARHRKEKRDLQAKITQKKKNATKKTRKGVNDECERLERELAEKQQAELEALEPAKETQIAESLEELAIDDASTMPNGESNTAPEDPGQANHLQPTPIDQPRQKKPNRQKARLARRAAEQEVEAAAAAEEASHLPNLREQEISAMKEQMQKLDLSETLIRPDGHCLFSACAHSMPLDLLVSRSGEVGKEPYQNVRYAAADFMASHPDDFAAFMEEPLDSYVRKIRDTAEWGGELELQAIARSFHVDINVLRANGQVEKIRSGSDDRDDAKPIWLAYYRHSFGLGEHYNALKKLQKS
jgi:OTU domain-containing protein 6